MKAIVILALLAVVVALVAIPTGAVLEREVEQARANRIEEQARLETARADAYAVRAQANQPVLVAVTGLVLVAAIVGGAVVVAVARRPATAPTPQPTVPSPPQIVTIILQQLPGESRPEFLRRLDAARHEYELPLVLNARPSVDAGHWLDVPER